MQCKAEVSFMHDLAYLNSLQNIAYCACASNRSLQNIVYVHPTEVCRTSRMCIQQKFPEHRVFESKGKSPEHRVFASKGKSPEHRVCASNRSLQNIAYVHPTQVSRTSRMCIQHKSPEHRVCASNRSLQNGNGWNV